MRPMMLPSGSLMVTRRPGRDVERLVVELVATASEFAVGVVDVLDLEPDAGAAAARAGRAWREDEVAVLVELEVRPS